MIFEKKLCISIKPEKWVKENLRAGYRTNYRTRTVKYPALHYGKATFGQSQRSFFEL